MEEKIIGPRTSHEEFFTKHLKLDRPEFAGIAEAVAKGEFDDADTTPTIDIGIEEEAADTMIVNDGRAVDPETGELFNA